MRQIQRHLDAFKRLYDRHSDRDTFFMWELEQEVRLMADSERIERDFSYHVPPDEATVALYAEMRHRARALALFIVDHVPEGREQALAVTKLEEVVMWANTGVARAGG